MATFGPPRRLRAGALVALLALVAVVWLNVAPHRHSDDWSERHCPACQVLRGDGLTAPLARAVTLVRPTAAGVDRVAEASPEDPGTAPLDSPPPGRSPPARLS